MVGYERMARSTALRLTVFLRFFSRVDPKSGGPVSWLKDKARAAALIEAILETPVLSTVAVGRAGDDDFAAIDTAEAVKRGATGKEVRLELQDREDTDHEVGLSLLLGAARTELRVLVSGAELAKHDAKALDALIAMTERCVAALAGAAGLSDGHVKVDHGSSASPFTFPLPRPPRENRRYPERSIVTFIDTAFHATDAGFARPGDPKALTVPPPPAPARMSASDGLITVRWAHSLDEAELATACSEHMQWIIDRIDTTVQPGFNQLGDQLDDVSNAEPRGALTLYDEEYALGYKAVLVLPDGSYEKSAWNEAKKILEARALPDGSAVEGVRIVVPLREHVFAIAAEAKAAGFDAVVYPEGPGAFWNPDPPGEWRTPPDPG